MFGTCKYYGKGKCNLYESTSETCNGPDSIALGYCGRRKKFKEEESKLEKRIKSN